MSARGSRSWWLALPLWLLSGLGSGLGNQLPQQWLASHEPEHKTGLLGAALLGGALASLFGVWLVADRAIPPALVRPALLLGLTAATALTLCLPGLSEMATFSAVFLLLRAGLNALTQLLDRELLVAGADAAANLANTTWRLVGMSTGSLAFAYAASHPQWLTAGVVALAAAALLAVASLPHTTHSQGKRPASLSLVAADRWLLAAGWAAYAALYLFAANLAYLLGDFLGLDVPAERAGRLLLVVYTASVAGAGLSALWQRWRGPLGGGAFVLSGCLIGAGTLGGLLPFAAAPWLLVSLAVAMGIAHAVFLTAARSRLTAAALAGRTALLAGFNNLPNWGAVGGFAGLSMVAVLSGSERTSFHPRALGLIAVLAGVSAACGWMVGLSDREAANVG